MTRSLLILIAVTGWNIAAFAAGDPYVSYSQTYIIVLNGSRAGTERVIERVGEDGSIHATSSHEILVSDGLETKRLAFETEMTLQKGTFLPTQYSCRYTSGDTRDSYEVTVRNGQIVRTLTRSGRTSESMLPFHPGFVIVDFNVYHHYDYLFRKYNLKRGGRQTFQNFLPLISAEIPIALTRLQDSEIPSGQSSVQVQNFRIEFVGSWTGIASCDKAGRLVRLLLQEKGLEVLRKDLQPD